VRVVVVLERFGGVSTRARDAADANDARAPSRDARRVVRARHSAATRARVEFERSTDDRDRARRARRPDARVRAKRGGAFLREFGPEDEAKKRGGKEGDQSGGFPALVEEKGVKPFSVNVMVKKRGPLNVVWNGVGTLQVPDAGEKTASVNLCRVCLAQRSELLIENFERLYPKLKKDAVEWALQPFDDPYGDSFDPYMVVPEDKAAELVPGNLQFLKKPRRVAPGQ